MKLIDNIYQQAVSTQRDEWIQLPIEDLIAKDPYGSGQVEVQNHFIKFGWWHHTFNEEIHHFVFITERKVLLIFNKKYLSGFKIENGSVQLLTDEELAEYD